MFTKIITGFGVAIVATIALFSAGFIVTAMAWILGQGSATAKAIFYS